MPEDHRSQKGEIKMRKVLVVCILILSLVGCAPRDHGGNTSGYTGGHPSFASSLYHGGNTSGYTGGHPSFAAPK